MQNAFLKRNLESLILKRTQNDPKRAKNSWTVPIFDHLIAIFEHFPIVSLSYNIQTTIQYVFTNLPYFLFVFLDEPNIFWKFSAFRDFFRKSFLVKKTLSFILSKIVLSVSKTMKLLLNDFYFNDFWIVEIF